MKKFQFSLETLLALRREKEQECQIDLARAIGKLAEIDRGIALAQNLAQVAFTRPTGSLDDMIARDKLWIKAMNDQKKLEETRTTVAANLNSARQRYREAHTRRNALDRLKQHQLELWRSKTRREEIYHLDEVSLGTMQRQHISGGNV